MKDKDLMLLSECDFHIKWRSLKHNEGEEAILHVLKRIRHIVIYSSVYIYHETSSNTCFSHPHMTMSDKKLYAFIYCTVE